jgi:hypothetical protein
MAAWMLRENTQDPPPGRCDDSRTGACVLIEPTSLGLGVPTVIPVTPRLVMGRPGVTRNGVYVWKH